MVIGNLLFMKQGIDSVHFNFDAKIGKMLGTKKNPTTS